MCKFKFTISCCLTELNSSKQNNVLGERHTKFRNVFTQMECVVRISSIPVIENSLKMSGKLYAKLKVFVFIDNLSALEHVLPFLSIDFKLKFRNFPSFNNT